MAKQGDTKRKQLLRQHNVSRARDHAAEEASAAAAGVDLSALRKQAVFHFDVQRHALLPAMLRCLGFSATGSIEEDQALLEGLQPPAPSAERTGSSGEHHVRKFRGGDRGPSTYWIQRWLSESPEDRKAHAEFNEAYMSLLREVVLPQCADPQGILFQRRPTFRCHVAGGGEATGVAHRDLDYGHPSSEINYWLPLTRVVAPTPTLTRTRTRTRTQTRTRTRTLSRAAPTRCTAKARRAVATTRRSSASTAS